MSGGFTIISEVVLFISVLWIVGRLCRIIGISPLIGEIAVGIIWGPQVLKLVPLVDKITHDGRVHYESLWQTLGDLGVTLMIAESGTHIHLDKVRKVGLKAVGVAILGTIVPLISAMLLAIALDKNSTLKNGFGAGCALAPTSVGIALKLLTESKQLNSMAGQTIVTAAFLDDIFSIILLVVLRDIGEHGTLKPLQFIIVFVSSVAFLVIGTLLSIYVFKEYIPKLLNKIPIYSNLNHQPRDEIHLLLIIGILCGYSFIGDKIGSHLLGAFIAGISFSQVNRSMYVWRRQFKRIIKWLMRFFFACSVAFTIPIRTLFSFEAFWKGLIFGLIPGIAGKVISGVASWEYKFIVGVAMVGRGEFAYLVGANAISLDLISDKLYSIVVWSLLIAVIISPLAFKNVLRNQFKNQIKSGIKYFKIQASGHHHCGIHFEIVDVLHNLRLDILEAKVETDGDVDVSDFIVGVADGDLDKQTIEEILHDLKEAVGEETAQVQICPVNENEILHLIKTHESNEFYHSNTPKVAHEEIPIKPGYQMTQSNSMMKVISAESKFGTTNYQSNSILESNQPNSIIEVLDDKLTSHNRILSQSMPNLKNTYTNEYWLEVKLMIKHKPYIFIDLINALQTMNIELTKCMITNYLETENIIIYGHIIGDLVLNSINIQKVKSDLKGVLSNNNIKCGNELLVKKLSRKFISLPNVQRFSDLLKCCKPTNPLLSGNSSDNCGYEIDIYCDKQYNLLNNIIDSFKVMELDIKSAQITDDSVNNKIEILLFSIENGVYQFDSIKRRKSIQNVLANFFKNLHIYSLIGIKAIEIGKEHIATPKQTAMNKANNDYIDEEMVSIDIKNDDELCALPRNSTAKIVESKVRVTPIRARKTSFNEQSKSIYTNTESQPNVFDSNDNINTILSCTDNNDKKVDTLRIDILSSDAINDYKPNKRYSEIIKTPTSVGVIKVLPNNTLSCDYMDLKPKYNRARSKSLNIIINSDNKNKKNKLLLTDERPNSAKFSFKRSRSKSAAKALHFNLDDSDTNDNDI